METQRQKTYEATKKFEELGLRMFPLHFPTATGCTCGKEGCTSRGKHPKNKNWQELATNKAEDFLRLSNERTNVGVCTGKVRAGYFFVVDVDDDRDGSIELKILEEKYGDLPDTLTVVTGKGYHLYFLTDVEVRNSANLVADGVDVRGEGGYVVAPPSKHYSGGHYQFDAGSPGDIAVAPEWLVKIARRERTNKSVGFKSADAIVAGGRNNHLTSWAGKMRRANLSPEALRVALHAENEARCRPPLDKSEVENIAASASRSFDANNESWEDLLAYGRGGTIKATPSNLAIIFQSHPEFQGALEYDSFKQEASWLRSPNLLWGADRLGPVNLDNDPIVLQNWLSKTMGVDANPNDIAMAIISAAKANEVDTLREYLLQLTWDGKKRISTWLIDYLGAEDTPYNRLIGRKWLIGAVARGLEPGCKLDTSLVLEGNQGIGKSTVGSILGGDEYFSDANIDFSDRYGPMFLEGVWIVELPELASLKGSNLERVKAFMTRREDMVRRPYAKQVEKRPRRCAFLGTTNEFEYLGDYENRRWWCVRIGKLKKNEMIRDREQLIAEAVGMFLGGEEWWFTNEEAKLHATESVSRTVEHPWTPDIVQFLMDKFQKERRLNFVSTGQLFRCLQVDRDKKNRTHQYSVAKIMRGLGYEPARRSMGRGYVPTDEKASMSMLGIIQEKEEG